MFRYCRAHVVSGAGYDGRIAMARLAYPYQHHTLVPFARRFDDQFRRVELINNQNRLLETNQVDVATSWLEDGLRRYDSSDH